MSDKTNEPKQSDLAEETLKADEKFWIPKFRFDEVASMLKKEKAKNLKLENEMKVCNEELQVLRQSRLDLTVKIVNLLNNY